MITQKDTTWLRWQLTRRGGLMWHETCATCENWERLEDGDQWGECLEPMAPHQQTSADQACSLYTAQAQEGGK